MLNPLVLRGDHQKESPGAEASPSKEKVKSPIKEQINAKEGGESEAKPTKTI